jgi:hypothetical protein
VSITPNVCDLTKFCEAEFGWGFLQESGTVKALFISPEYLEGLSFSATLGEAQKLKVARAPKIFCHRSFFLLL